VSYAKAIRERQHNAIKTNDIELVRIGEDADKAIDGLLTIHDSQENQIIDLKRLVKWLQDNAK